MNKKTEKKIEGKVGKKVAGDIKKEVEREVRERVEKEVEEVRKEVEKKLHVRLYEGAKDSAIRFKREFREQVVIAVSAAFGFLIALSWRSPIQKSVDIMIDKMGLGGSAVYLEFLSALFITLIAVLGLMWVSRWKSRE